MERKCNCCGSNELIEGVVQTNEVLKLVFIDNTETKKLLPKAKKIKSCRCAKCGNVSLSVITLIDAITYVIALFIYNPDKKIKNEK